MNNIFLIAKREYMEQIRGRAFKMTTLGLPAVFALIVGVAYLSSLGIGANKHFAIAGDDPKLVNGIRNRIVGDKDNKATVDAVTPATDGDKQELLNKVKSKGLDGLLWVRSSNGDLPTATYYSKAAGDFFTTANLKDALNNGMVESLLTGTGMKQEQAEAIVKGIPIDTYQVKKDGSIVRSNAQMSFYKGYVMAILLSMTTIMYGMGVARSIIQEKTSRIFEVMLSTVKPSDMLAGKLIGVGSVGLTQIAIWLVAGALIIASPFAAALMSGDFAVHFSWYECVLFPVYFVLGFLLYSSLFAGLAATCETEQELQMYMPLAAAPTWLSFSMIMLIVNDSNSIWSVLASFFPPTAPIIMFLRMASETPPLWQFAVSIGLMLITILGVLWFSSKLYRVGILMYGKRATIPELLRWLRYS